MKMGSVYYVLTLLVVLGAAVANDAAEVEMVENWGRSRWCQRQIEGQRLGSCGRYLRDSSRDVSEGSRWREEFPMCCEDLEQVSEHCRCEAIRQAMERQLGGIGEAGGREAREMWWTARSLPSLCRIPPNYCENI